MKVNVYTVPSPDCGSPLPGNAAGPSETTLWNVEPVPVQVQVTAWPAGTVSCAGVVPLCALWKKLLPTMIWPTGPPPPLLPPLLVPLVPVLSLEHPRATAATAAASQMRDLPMTPPRKSRGTLPAPPCRLTLSVITDLVKTSVVTGVEPRTNVGSSVAIGVAMRRLRRIIKQRKPFQSLQQEVFLEVLRTGHALV